MFNYLSSISKSANFKIAQVKSVSFFKKYYMPDIKKHKWPVRSIIDYYEGFSPTWYDIATNNICKIHFYDNIVDSINAGKNVIIIGDPGSGKTTLMKQIAWNNASNVFYFNKLLITDCRQFIKSVVGRNGIRVFIDDFTDSWDAYKELSKQKNLQVIAAEGSWEFDRADPYIEKENTELFDISCLSKADLNAILGKITNIFPNQRINKDRLFSYIERYYLDSLLSTIYVSIHSADIDSKIKKLLMAVEKDPLAMQIFILASYMECCHSKVTMSMLMSFMNEYRWDMIYNMIDKMRSVVYFLPEDISCEEGEDLFSTKNRIISQIVLENCDKQILKKIMQFVNLNISHQLIYNYNEFRRYAVDADYISKAFSDIEEGSEFYQQIINREPNNPFNYQQYALYLYRKHYRREAFIQIDKALQRNPKNTRIKNSYAEILFMNNIHSTGDESVRAKTVKQSINIVEECIKSDERKNYHVELFGRLAVLYSREYINEYAKILLERSKMYIEIQKKRCPWRRELTRSAKLLEERLKEMSGSI